MFISITILSVEYTVNLVLCHRYRVHLERLSEGLFFIGNTKESLRPREIPENLEGCVLLTEPHMVQNATVIPYISCLGPFLRL